MGTCCASRADPTGKTKGGSTETAGGAKQINPMDDVKTTLTNIFKDCKSILSSDLISFHKI